MTERTAAPAQGARRAKTARRGGSSGRLVVGEYVGRPARDAAQAVRRAGLRPGLERSFGCEAELVGLIVAQEPAAGDELARDGMVRLYVADPGVGPVDEAADAPEAQGDAPASVSGGLPQARLSESDSPHTPGRARRPRKPGLAGQAATQVFDPSPAPTAPDRLGEAQAQFAHVLPAQAWSSQSDTRAPDGEELDEGVVDERGEEELSHEEFVVHVDDVFAGRASKPPAWHRVYPRRRPGWPTWLACHPRLLKAAGGMLAVWVVVGLAAALAGHPGRSPSASVVSGGGRRAATPMTGVDGPASVARAGAVRPAAGSPRVHTRSPVSTAVRRTPRPASVGAAAASPAGTGVQAAPSPRPSPPAPASTLPAPASPETQGGLFSP